MGSSGTESQNHVLTSLNIPQSHGNIQPSIGRNGGEGDRGFRIDYGWCVVSTLTIHNMKKLLYLIAFPWILAIQLGAAQTFSWMHDLDEARLLASEQDKPLLVVFRCEP